MFRARGIIAAASEAVEQPRGILRPEVVGARVDGFELGVCDGAAFFASWGDEDGALVGYLEAAVVGGAGGDVDAGSVWGVRDDA